MVRKVGAIQRILSASVLSVCAFAPSALAMPARLSADEPENQRERSAREHVSHAHCAAELGLFFPGIAQFCLGKPAEGAVMAGLGAAELGTAAWSIAARDEGLKNLDYPTTGLPLVAFQYLWVYSYVDGVFERQRAAHLRYVPLDTPSELALAPFTPKVLAYPDVWAGILASLALGLGASVLIEGGVSTRHVGDDPRLFGHTFSPAAGYPLAAAVGIGIFDHVAVAEESVFRGLIQSQMSREMDPTRGWIGASLAFGAAHAGNVASVEPEHQAAYLGVAVPLITLLGGYLGLTYRRHGYSLAPSVAIHFWYDLLISAADYIHDPQHSSISGRIALPF